MNRFLWVEDFGGEMTVQATVKSVFGSLNHFPELSDRTDKYDLCELLEPYISLALNFSEALAFIVDPDKLHKVDYVILDVDLPIDEGDSQYSDEVQNMLRDILGRYAGENDKQKEEGLKKVAGYQLYLELIIKRGFPENNILFCSDHADRLETIANAFSQAKISVPVIFNKGQKQEITTWLKQRIEPQTDYEYLRKGVLEACEHLSAEIERDKSNIRFGDFLKRNGETVKPEDLYAEMKDYLHTLQTLLPVREPQGKSKGAALKLFVRTLAHEWEDDATPPKLNNLSDSDKPLHAFAWIMKCVRNWSTHTKILDRMDERQLAFVFLSGMRVMFKLSNDIQAYEELLLKLFVNKRLLEMTTENEQRQKLSKSYANIMSGYCSDQAEKSKTVTFKNADFITILRAVQNNDKDNQKNFDYIQGLYQIFWHGLSPITLSAISVPNLEQSLGENKIQLEYTCSFTLHNYGTGNDFLNTLACCIYEDSW